MRIIHLILAISSLASASCGRRADGAKPTPYSHSDPAFTLDLPPGYQPEQESDGPLGKMLAFRGPHAADYLAVSWKSGETWTAIQTRDFRADADVETGAIIAAKGDLAGGGAWAQLKDRSGDHVESYLLVGDTLITCQSDGRQAVLDACKTLR